VMRGDVGRSGCGINDTGTVCPWEVGEAIRCELRFVAEGTPVISFA